MHKEILTPEQTRLLPLVKSFARDFYLVGGTAIALHIGHRRSIDFDLFTAKSFANRDIRRILRETNKIERVIRDEEGQYTVILNGVYLTFFQYPFKVDHKEKLGTTIQMPGLLTLAAMKAYALGRRAKWKDYVDLYFVMRKYHGARAIVVKAKHIFGREFNEKLFREQLAYFKDIDYTEEVIFMAGHEVSDQVIKKGLLEMSLR